MSQSTRVTAAEPAGEAWRYRCPEGHTSIKQHRESFYCHSCGLTYDGDPIDAAADGSPLDEADPQPRDDLTMVQAAKLLWAYVGDTDTTARARDVYPHPQQMGFQLREAADHGWVECVVHSSRGHRWRVTEAGARFLGPNDWGGEVDR